MVQHYDIATRAQALALLQAGVPNRRIESLTGITSRHIYRLLDKAIERGYDPKSPKPVILDSYVTDDVRPGRPRKQEDAKDEILSKVRSNRHGREKTCAHIANEIGGVSAMTVWRILHNAGMKKTKPTRKPGLTEFMRKERLAWCIQHKDWTLDDWKKVIWTDETSVVLSHRRGSYRVWRTSKERVVKSCIRERWKGYSEFMFWGSFSYDKKGPFHIWRPETARERKEVDKELEELNEILEPSKREEWELEVGVRRLGLRNRPGKPPQWKFTKATGKITRGTGSGIDWYRYQKHIILPKLIPFARKCGDDALVQEDKAPSHAHPYQGQIYRQAGIQQLDWCPNSPDLNMIEPCWFYLKRETTKAGAPQSRNQGERIWRQAWADLPQEMIQRWIERIPHHIRQIITLEGGNEYVEGRLRS